MRRSSDDEAVLKDKGFVPVDPRAESFLAARQETAEAMTYRIPILKEGPMVQEDTVLEQAAILESLATREEFEMAEPTEDGIVPWQAEHPAAEDPDAVWLFRLVEKNGVWMLRKCVHLPFGKA